MKKIIAVCLSILFSIHLMWADCPDRCNMEQTVLSGTLTTQTLSSSNVYLLRGCVIVPNNVVLTIPAGTLIMGEKATNGTLVVERGGKLISQGTSALPITFTSDQTTTCRAVGDWGGIIVSGHAPNNTGGNIVIAKGSCTNITAGGTTATDSAGVLKFMRIEYAKTGLSLLSVGSHTVLEQVQITKSELNGMELFGGNVNGKQLAFYDNHGNDIEISLGNQSKLQQVLILRLDPNAYTSPESYGVLVKNNDDVLNNYESALGTANSHPVMSNFTIIGPEYCGAATSNKFNGVEFRNNAEGAFYNSYIDGVNVGISLNGAKTIDNANRSVSPQLFFGYNSLVNYRTFAQSIGPWVPGCATGINDWLLGISCSQPGIETGNVENLSATICGSFCTTSPVFTVAASDLEPANYASLSDPFFTNSLDRGAFNNTDWLSSWSKFCTPDYCSSLMKTSISVPLNVDPNLEIYPNPATKSVHIRMAGIAEETATIRIVNVLGQEMYTRSISSPQMAHIIEIAHWNKGVYYVQCIQKNKVIASQLFIVD